MTITKCIFYLENKGIVFKARWFERPDKTQARPLFKWNNEGIAQVISRRNNDHARVLSGQNVTKNDV